MMSGSERDFLSPIRVRVAIPSHSGFFFDLLVLFLQSRTVREVMLLIDLFLGPSSFGKSLPQALNSTWWWIQNS